MVAQEYDLPSTTSDQCQPTLLIPNVVRATLLCHGTFCTADMVRNRLPSSQCRTFPVIRQMMRTISVPRTDILHIGMYKNVTGRTRVFYKCPPDLISDEALNHYGVTREEYMRKYTSSQYPNCRSRHLLKWEEYTQLVFSASPYTGIHSAQEEHIPLLWPRANYLFFESYVITY